MFNTDPITANNILSILYKIHLSLQVRIGSRNVWVRLRDIDEQISYLRIFYTFIQNYVVNIFFYLFPFSDRMQMVADSFQVSLKFFIHSSIRFTWNFLKDDFNSNAIDDSWVSITLKFFKTHLFASKTFRAFSS